MTDNTWSFDLENRIYTIIKAKTIKKLNNKYPDITYTQSNINDITKFPTVYIHKLPDMEISGVLEGDEIVAEKVSFQVDIYSDKSQVVASEVARVIVEAFKELRFSITASPSFQNETTVFRNTMRVSRVIGSGDIL